MTKRTATVELDRRLDTIVAELAQLETDAKRAGHLMVGNVNVALAQLRASQKRR
jgi:hypothetical protein